MAARGKKGGQIIILCGINSPPRSRWRVFLPDHVHGGRNE